MTVKRKNGYYVLSEKLHPDASGKLKRRNLGGPYTTRKGTVKRLKQVELFKHQK